MTVAADLREETRVFNEQLRQLLVGMPPLESVPPAVTRRARREGRSIFPPPVYLPEARWVDVPSRDGGLRARVLAPTARRRISQP